MNKRTRATFFALATSYQLLALFALGSPVLAECCACATKETPNEKICLTDPSTNCASMVTKFVSTNKQLANVTCDPIKLEETTACQPISSGKASAVCAIGPLAAIAYQPKPTTNASATPTGAIALTSPTLNVQIPGLRFANVVAIPGEKTDIPYLAQYVSAVFKYLLGIGVIAAAVMIVYGGFKYILSANAAGIQGGKEIIKDALIGLLLMLGCVTILQMINPETSTLKPLRISVVKKEEWGGGRNPPGETPPGDYVQLTAADVKPMTSPYTALTIKKDCKRDARIKPEYIDQALDAQHQSGVPAAFLVAQWSLESGFGKSCIGPPGKPFNCFGYKCYVSALTPPYQGQERPVTQPAPTCHPSCFIAQTQEPKRENGKIVDWKVKELNWACFLTYDNIFIAQSGRAALHRKGWDKYNGSPESFAKFVENGKYAGPGYAKELIQIMKDQCLL